MQGDTFGFQAWAAGTVEANGTVVGIRGAACIRQGVGDYLITMDRSLTHDEGIFIFSLTVNILAGTGRFCNHVHVSPTVINALIQNAAGVPTDAEFHFLFARFAG